MSENSEPVSVTEQKSTDSSKKPLLSYNVKAAAFLATSGVIGLLFGFSGALAAAKKQGKRTCCLTFKTKSSAISVLDPTSFDKGLIGDVAATPKQAQKVRLHEAGARLATRALGIGTICAIGGCSVLFFGIWKLSGAKDLQDFRQKAGQILPRIPKNDPPQSRTEFSGVNDFLQYVIDKDKEEKALKKQQNHAVINDSREWNSKQWWW